MDDHGGIMDTSTSSDISDLMIRSFSNYSSEDLDASDIVVERKCANAVDNMVQDLLLHRAKNNTSYAETSNVAQMLNNVPGALSKIPSKIDTLKSEASLVYKYEYYVFCESCDILIEIYTVCDICKKKTKKKG